LKTQQIIDEALKQTEYAVRERRQDTHACVHLWHRAAAASFALGGKAFFSRRAENERGRYSFLKLITEKRFQNYTIQKFP
jgi:hypothetical protein